MIAQIPAVSTLKQLKEIELQHRLARLSVAGFIRYRYMATGRRIIWNWHLDLLSEVLEGIRMRHLKRIIINMPPRFLKSEVVGQAWQAFMIGRDNSSRSSMVSASYAASLAHRDSRKTLEIIQSPWYAGIFGQIELVKTQQDDWETAGGASRAAAGALGPVTGKGGDHLLADDLLKPTEANSELVREKTNDWNGETFRSRLNDTMGGTITHLCQRLHERDPAGYLLEQAKNPDADQWYHVNLPLENVDRKAKVYSYGRFRHLRKRDELLHPERIGTKEVKAMKIAMKNNFEGQYNQRPMKMTGGKFRPALLNRMAKPPEQIAKEMGLIVSFYIDIAVTEKQVEKDDPDFFALAVMARDSLHRKWILDMWSEQCEIDKAADVLIAFWVKWMRLGYGPRFIKGEKIGLQHAFRPMLKAQCRTAGRSMLPLLDMPYSRDATLKLEPFAGALNAGSVWVPEHALWLPALETEMRTVPKGRHDDLCTAVSYGIQDLEDQAAGDVPMATAELPSHVITGKMLEDAERRRKVLLGEIDDDD